MGDKTTVYVVTPLQNKVRPELCLFREWLMVHEERYYLVFSVSEAQPVAHNRNRIARKFLESDADFLLSVDSDQVPGCNPLDYVEHDLDVLGFPYPTYRAHKECPIVWFPGPANDEGLVEVEKVASGVLLIARRVLEHPAMRGPFMDYWDDEGLLVESEDFSFCRRARWAGFSVWCDMSVPAHHWKEVDLLTLWQSLRGGESDG